MTELGLIWLHCDRSKNKILVRMCTDYSFITIHLMHRSAQVFRFSFRCMTAIAGKLCYGNCHSTIPLEFPSCNCNGTKTPALTVGCIKRIVINKTAATQPEMCERRRIRKRGTRLQAFCERSRKRNFWCLSRPDAHCKKNKFPYCNVLTF